jgi:hypothetical protein
MLRRTPGLCAKFSAAFSGRVASAGLPGLGRSWGCSPDPFTLSQLFQPGSPLPGQASADHPEQACTELESERRSALARVRGTFREVTTYPLAESY